MTILINNLLSKTGLKYFFLIQILLSEGKVLFLNNKNFKAKNT